MYPNSDSPTSITWGSTNFQPPIVNYYEFLKSMFFWPWCKHTHTQTNYFFFIWPSLQSREYSPGGCHWFIGRFDLFEMVKFIVDWTRIIVKNELFQIENKFHDLDKFFEKLFSKNLLLLLLHLLDVFFYSIVQLWFSKMINLKKRLWLFGKI